MDFGFPEEKGAAVANDWQRVGTAIADRIAALSLTKAEVIKRSGVSDKTLDGYIDGQPIKRADKRRELCAALGWAPESIDSLLTGGEPTPLQAQPDGPIADLRSEMLRRHLALQQQIDELWAVVKAGASIDERRPLRLAAHDADVESQDVGSPANRPTGVPVEPEGP